jgi:hypothetical protein
MKKNFLIALLGVLVNVLALAQQGPPQQLTHVSAANQQSLSSSLGLHAFPAKDQTPQQRQTDESACYGWAKQDSGFDPIAAGSNAVASGYSAPPADSGVRSAAAGAAGGATTGAIAGNAGKGAAIGQQQARYEDAWCRGEPKLKLNSRLKPNCRHRKPSLRISRELLVPAWKRRATRSNNLRHRRFLVPATFVSLLFRLAIGTLQF